MKYSLDITYENDFDLIGISTSMADYRLTWLINRLFSLRLKRAEDIVIEAESAPPLGTLFAEPLENESFATFSFQKGDHSEEVTLIANKSHGLTLVASHPRTDYFMRIDASEWSPEEYVRRLDAEKEIQTVRWIDIAEIERDIDIFYTNE